MRENEYAEVSLIVDDLYIVDELYWPEFECYQRDLE